MKILHGTWIPHDGNEFMRGGNFYLWVETDRTQGDRQTNRHPQQLVKPDLEKFLNAEFGIVVPRYRKISEREGYPKDRGIVAKYFILPSTDTIPLPSSEMSRYLEAELPAATGWKIWEIDCYSVDSIIDTLNDIHFICLYRNLEIQLGADLLFWYYYTQSFREILLKDRYIPALKYRELSLPAASGKTIGKTTGKTTGKTNNKASTLPSYEIYPGWEIISEVYEKNIAEYATYLPPVCTGGFPEADVAIEFYDPATLLRHFSECLLNSLVTSNTFPATFAKKITTSRLLNDCLHLDRKDEIISWQDREGFELYQQWQDWKQKIVASQENASFYLCFQLRSAAETTPDDWYVKFIIIAKEDPSLQLELEDYWHSDAKNKKAIERQFGKNFAKDLLLNLGFAARIYPPIWQGLETDKPVGFSLTLAAAFEFLSETAWVLEDAGYKVIIPAWWTPQGRGKAKLKLKASSSKSGKSQSVKGLFQLETIVEYQYELAIGDERVSRQEWQELVDAKIPLVRFRGEWMELDPQKMKQMLEFWQSHQEKQPELTLREFLKLTANDEELVVEHDDSLAAMMAKLNDPSHLEPIENPPELQGNLREYQKRGVAWINYLEQLGLHGCLADDMGLGKTIQVIATLVIEKSQFNPTVPTLLIAPTSVLGNWQREIEKFAPHLRVTIHHGSNRVRDLASFQAILTENDVVITSYSLVRKDSKLLQPPNWQRIVIDEAQNIKNPTAEQTKAILKLQSDRRLALTGTPVENRLLDLWSIFNFLNPGYLGKEAQFRKTFEVPIQKDNSQVQSIALKKLVQPFILRRLKTDKQIIKDLPDKIEHKQYCNLTKEQASLYEAVVKDIVQQLDKSEGIQRKGMMLATLMKLKQICNHPRQFLQDGSKFSADRSHKLQRLTEMLEEIIDRGESLLIFTQFTEIGESLQQYLKQHLHYPTYYLHGGTSRNKREEMITEFQAEDTPASAFVLSLKAGGVGITLTKANHVFHFDRWWNPAVEDQATDRAFRIGQQRNVFVHKFVTIGTLEERIDLTIENKKKLSGAIVGTDESWLTELDNESFKELITLNRQAVV
jgi:SNF2 family DNA or RNA helicase